MEPLSFDIMDRLRVIFESNQYTIRHEHCSGYVRLVDGTERYFIIINGLCKPEEVQQLFNCEGISHVILKHIPEAVSIDYVNSDNHGFVKAQLPCVWRHK